MNDNFTSAIHKIKDFGFKTGSFKGDDGKDVNYTQLVVRAVIDGDIEEFVLSGKSPISPKLLRTMLKAADEGSSSFLGGNEKQ